jgi:hypothetical protein
MTGQGRTGPNTRIAGQGTPRQDPTKQDKGRADEEQTISRQGGAFHDKAYKRRARPTGQGRRDKTSQCKRRAG